MSVSSPTENKPPDEESYLEMKRRNEALEARALRVEAATADAPTNTALLKEGFDKSLDAQKQELAKANKKFALQQRLTKMYKEQSLRVQEQLKQMKIKEGSSKEQNKAKNIVIAPQVVDCMISEEDPVLLTEVTNAKGGEQKISIEVAAIGVQIATDTEYEEDRLLEIFLMLMKDVVTMIKAACQPTKSKPLGSMLDVTRLEAKLKQLLTVFQICEKLREQYKQTIRENQDRIRLLMRIAEYCWDVRNRLFEWNVPGTKDSALVKAGDRIAHDGHCLLDAYLMSLFDPMKTRNTMFFERYGFFSDDLMELEDHTELIDVIDKRGTTLLLRPKQFQGGSVDRNYRDLIIDCPLAPLSMYADNSTVKNVGSFDEITNYFHNDPRVQRMIRDMAVDEKDAKVQRQRSRDDKRRLMYATNPYPTAIYERGRRPTG